MKTLLNRQKHKKFNTTYICLTRNAKEGPPGTANPSI